jgi:hypothetical protein
LSRGNLTAAQPLFRTPPCRGAIMP